MIHRLSWGKSPLAHTFSRRKWDWEGNRIYTYQCHPFMWKFPLQNDFAFGTASCGSGTFCIWWCKPAHFPILSQTECCLLPAGSPLSIINTSVDRQWTFYKGHLHKSEHRLPCIYQRRASSLFCNFSHFPFASWKSLPGKHEQEALHYHHVEKLYRNTQLRQLHLCGNVLPPRVTGTALNLLRA